jgi:hypothetical protein
MAKRLTTVDVDEVSLVASPANRGSKVTLFKAERVEKECPVCDPAPPPEPGTYCRMCGEKADAADYFCRSCGVEFWKKEKNMKKDEAKEAEVKEAEKAAVAPEATPEPTPDPEPAKKADDPTPDPEPAAKVDEPTPEPEPAAKTELTEVEKKDAEIAELRKANLELVRVGKVREAKERVTSVMKSIPAAVDELSEKLVALAEADAELAEYVEGVLAKASALIEKGGLEQAAETGHGNELDITPEAQIAKIAADKMAADPKLTKAQAVAAAWRANPGLYNEYEKNKAEAQR